MPRAGFIDHIGIGVPDLVVAKQYYDELMSVLGLRQRFDTGSRGPLNYGPDGAQGSQLFLYQAEEPSPYSRSQTGLHHLAFLVATRAVVREAHVGRSRATPSSWTHPASSQVRAALLATYWLDPHGCKLGAGVTLPRTPSP